MPAAEVAEGSPESALGGLLVEGSVDVRGEDCVASGGESLDVSLTGLERASQRQGKVIDRLERGRTHHHDVGGLEQVALVPQTPMRSAVVGTVSWVQAMPFQWRTEP